MDIPNSIESFLQFIEPKSRFLLVAIHPNTGEIIAEPFTDYPQGAAWALDWNGKGWNLYWTVNLTRRGLSKKASKADIQAARAFWADVDPDTKRSGDYLTARAHLLNGVLTELVAAKSTIIIDSGSGLQPLFLLNHPIALNGHMEAYEQLNAKVGAKFHGPGTFNYDRILRLPFTLNYPTKSKLARGYPDTPSMARVIDCSGIRYGEEEIARLCRSRVEEFLESHPKAKARWGGSREGLNDATGSGFDFSMVAMLKAGRLSEEEVKEALYSWAQGSKDGRGSREWDRYFRRCWERTANIHDTQAATEPGRETDAETITRLAALSLLEYSRVRKGEAERLGVRVTDLDAEVKRAREGARVDLSAAVPAGKGQGLNVHEADPWPYSIDLNEVLNELVTEINRYAVLSVHADTAIALWIAHTYVYDAGDISPFLFLTSPEKRCGKSTALILLLGLVNRPMVASNISPSSIFRVIEACRPTLLIDEADTFFNKNEELRGVMNSGHTKSLAYVIRTVDVGGGVFEPRQFSTWAPKAVAGIKRLADTLEDRSIIIELKRKLPGEHTERVAKFNGDTIRQKLTRWARDNFEAIKCADPQLPAGVYNRLADNWLPLLAIAEIAGAEWAGRATKALLAGMDDDSRTDSAGVILLSDLKDLFKEKNNPESLATREILDRLHEMDDRSWPAWGRLKKPITSDAFARLLKPFKVKPQQIKTHSGKGYRLADLLDAFDRYIPTKIPTSPPPKSKPRNQQDTEPFSDETNPKPEAWQVSSDDQPKPVSGKEGFEVSTRKGEDTSESVEGTYFTTQPKDSPSLADDENWDSLVKFLPADTARF